MKYFLLLLVASLIFSGYGCSGVSTVERASFTRLDARESYIESNPDGRYNDNIRNGEIKKGMDIYEVIASWGLPNVYIISRKNPREQWIYYIEEMDSRTTLIYTLTFESNFLEGWDIDLKRYVDQRIVYDINSPMTVPSELETTLKKH